MEFCSGYSAIASAVVLTNCAYKWGKYWYYRKTDAQKYIEAASDEQLMYEATKEETDFELEGETDKKRLPVRHRGSFRNFLVQMGKAKFGSPSRNEANRLVVRKYLYDICKEHGLVARHINEHIDIATGLVFVSSQDELLGLAIAQTRCTQRRDAIRNELGGTRPSLA